MREHKGSRACIALRLCAFGSISVLLGLRIHADDAAAPDQADALTPSHAWRLPSNTEIHLRITESVGSNTCKRGQHFGIETAEPVIVDGVELIAKGMRGEGEVIHAEKASMGGRGGELILTARLIHVRDTEVRLKSFTVGVGQDRMNLANGIGMTLGLPGLFIKGKNIVVPAGSDVFAKVATEVLLPPPQPQVVQSSPGDAPSAEISREYKNDDSSQQ
jgi:hypothetical protein